MNGDGKTFQYHNHFPFLMRMGRMRGPQNDFGFSSKQVKVSTREEKRADFGILSRLPLR